MEFYPNNFDIPLKPLNKEELKKINEEILQNIEKSKNHLNNKNKELISSLKDFIQNEVNASIFYQNLALTYSNSQLKQIFYNIKNECDKDIAFLKKYYKDLNNEDFIEQNLQIKKINNLKQALLFAIKEEIKSYDKICNILLYLYTEKFYQKAFKKLGRINFLQYLIISNNF